MEVIKFPKLLERQMDSESKSHSKYQASPLFTNCCQKELFRTTGFRKRMKQRDTADIAATINLFRSNVQKFEPRSTIATKKPLAVENKQNIIIPVEDTLFTNRGKI